jgi:hypothetical protein
MRSVWVEQVGSADKIEVADLRVKTNNVATVRFVRLPAEVPPYLGVEPVAFTVVTILAGKYDVVPCVLATTGARDDMVNGVSGFFEAPLADTAVSDTQRTYSQLRCSPGYVHVAGKSDDSRAG